jgi:hypothetical protein
MLPILTPTELALEHTRRPGLIPTELHALTSEIRWTDLDSYHCYHGFFSTALAEYAALRRTPASAFLSGLDALKHDGILTGCMPPTGFIFHAGRCGSTLLVKILARSRSNMVFSEAQPHNQIWRAIQADGGTDLYKALLIAMGRPRLPSYRSHIVKFTSFNIMQFERIRKAFPDVPALFLFRRPGAILASMHREAPGWLGRDLGIGRIWVDGETAVTDFFEAAADANDSLFWPLDYQQLTPERLPEILRFFNIDASPSDLHLMTAEFSWDAKGRQRRPFVPRSGESGTSAALEDLYRRLTSLAITAPATAYPASS